MAHGLPRSILRHHLRSVGGTFTRAFESNFARTRPPDDVAFHVGDRDDGVVECRENVRDAVVNVFAALRFDYLRLLDAIRAKGKVLRGRRSRSSRFLSFFLRLNRSGNRYRR